MKHSADIYNELKEISSFLAEMEKTNVFSVPENYFSTFNKQILQRIKAPGPEEEKIGSFILPASEPLFADIPEGYFDSLPGIILRKIKSLEIDNAGEELKQLSPMLYAVQNENVFAIPEGYFETLPGIINNAVRSQTKVVAIKKRSMVWEYAAAAILSGVMAVTALWISNNSSNQKSVETAGVNTIPTYIKEANQYKNQEQINEGISDLADDEIIKYLEATGSNADDEMLAAIVQEKELPSEEDYLRNENTLETFLNKTDLKNNGN